MFILSGIISSIVTMRSLCKGRWPNKLQEDFKLKEFGLGVSSDLDRAVIGNRDRSIHLLGPAPSCTSFTYYFA